MNIKSITIGIVLGLLISLSVLVSAQEVVSKNNIHDIELVRRAKVEGSTSAQTTTSTGESSAKSTGTTATHGGGNTSTFVSPTILENGILFYISVSVTCLLWVTGKSIDVLTDRLDKYAETTTHKI